MADQKLSDLTAATPATADLLYCVDVSDTTDGSAGSSRKATVGDVLALAVPAGGTTGQVLKKTSAADYATAWQDEAAGGVTSVNGRTGAVQLPPAPAVYTPDLTSLLGWFNVRDYGATGDGTTDDTAAVQAAVTACGNAGGGTVYCPPGNYYFAGRIGTLPANVQLVGSHRLSNSHSNNYDTAWQPGHDLAPTAGGTTFLITETTGGASGTPFITQSTNTGVGGICFHYPNVSTASGTPTAYPWTIKQSACNDAWIDGCEFSLAYQAIWCEWAFRNTVRNVRGNVLSQGVRCEGGADVTRLENVHFGPWRTYGTTLDNWIKANLTAFNFGRNDLIEWVNCFVFGANYGIRLYADTAHNISGPSACWGHIQGGGLDLCNTCVRVEQTQVEPVTISDVHMTTLSGYCVDVTNTFTGVLKVSGGFLYSAAGTYLRTAGNGHVSLSDAYLVAALNPGTTPGTPTGVGVTATAGVVRVSNNTFRDTQTHLSLGAGVSRAVAVGNLTPGWTVSNSMTAGTYTVANNQ